MSFFHVILWEMANSKQQKGKHDEKATTHPKHTTRT